VGDPADGDHGRRRVVVDRQLDLAPRPVAMGQPRHFPDRRREPALRFGAELQEAGEISRAPPGQEHILL